MSILIDAERLQKSYVVKKRSGGLLKSFVAPETVHVEALRDVSFQIARGELVGYIGPNGAGKSTTVKILSGILTPDGGRCTVLGAVPWKERVRVVSRIGVVFGQRSQLWWDLPVIDSFELLKEIYRVHKESYQKTKDELIDRLALAPLLQTPVRQLSLGQRMRCELAASLLHNPEILFLDEPTIGLDAVSKLAVREFIMDQNQKRGLTVILTTHDMDDIAALCSRVLLIGQGRLLHDGSARDLLMDRHERRITATLLKEPLPEWFRGIKVKHLHGQEWLVCFDPDQVPAAAIISILNERCGIIDIIVENPNIEEVVAQRYAQMEEAAR